jgi:S-adenosylmethionine:tRNA ribosyltransferase-isomerase
MLTRDFDYDLPPHLIARYPAPNREDSRLMRVPKSEGAFEHHSFRDLPQLLRRGDLLVLNDTRVIPARLLGVRLPDRGKVEALLLRSERDDAWWAMVRPGKKIRTGDRLVFAPKRLEATVEAYGPKGGGERLLRFEWQGDWWETLEAVGHTPLPPYILKARKQLEQRGEPEETEDRSRYQTVYAGEARESVAAPTAGLHFSPSVLEELGRAGIEMTFVTLGVGAGTFQPIKTETVEDHPIHEERFAISQEAAARINLARREGRRIVAVGTTVVRALETAALCSVDSPDGEAIHAHSGWTNLFISPGFTFRVTDALLTNFHLPRSSLLVLVSALVGRERILSAYREAVENNYRFYSYGDCMLIE